VQASPAGVDTVIKQTADFDGEEIPQREEKEPGSAGVAVIAQRAKLLKGHDYKGVMANGDKVTRSKPYRSQVEAGNVFLLRTGDPVRDTWIEVYITELTGFPTAKHDDQVDGSSCAYNQLLLEEPKYGAVTW
jgi:predicted phage terminase large subunit-like protein